MNETHWVNEENVLAAEIAVRVGLGDLLLYFDRLRTIGLFTLLPLVVFVCSMEAQTLRKVATIELSGPKGERFDSGAINLCPEHEYRSRIQQMIVAMTIVGTLVH